MQTANLHRVVAVVVFNREQGATAPANGQKRGLPVISEDLWLAGTNYELTRSVRIEIPVSGHGDGLAKQTGGKTKAAQDHIRASGWGRCGRGNVMQGGGGGSSVRLQWCGEQRMSWSSVLQNGLQPCWRLCVHQQGGFKFIMSRYMQPVEEAQYVWGWGLGLKTPAELWGWRCRRTDKWCNSNFCQEFNISWHNNWFLKYILKIILVLQWYITGWMVSQPLHPPITCVCTMPLQWAGRITVGNTLKAGLDYFFFTCCLLKWHYFAYFSCRLYIVGIPWTAKREICVLTLHDIKHFESWIESSEFPESY